MALIDEIIKTRYKAPRATKNGVEIEMTRKSAEDRVLEVLKQQQERAKANPYATYNYQQRNAADEALSYIRGESNGRADNAWKEYMAGTLTPQDLVDRALESHAAMINGQKNMSLKEYNASSEDYASNPYFLENAAANKKNINAVLNPVQLQKSTTHIMEHDGKKVDISMGGQYYTPGIKATDDAANYAVQNSVYADPMTMDQMIAAGDGTYIDKSDSAAAIEARRLRNKAAGLVALDYFAGYEGGSNEYKTTEDNNSYYLAQDELEENYENGLANLKNKIAYEEDYVSQVTDRPTRELTPEETARYNRELSEGVAHDTELNRLNSELETMEDTGEPTTYRGMGYTYNQARQVYDTMAATVALADYQNVVDNARENGIDGVTDESQYDRDALTSYEETPEDRARNIVHYLADDTYRQEMETFGDESGANPYLKYDKMSKEEQGTAIYLAATGQIPELAIFLESINRTLDARAQQARTEGWEQFAEEHPILAGLSTAVMSLVSPLAFIDTGAQNLSNLLTGEDAPVNANTFAYMGSRYAETVSNTITKEMGEGGRFLTNVALSIVQRVPKALMGPLSLAYVVTGAAGDASYHAVQNGATPEQAFTLGVVAGALEAITAKLPLDKLKIFQTSGGVNTLKEWAAFTLKQSAIEFTEEALSETGNILANIIVMRENSDFEQTRRGYIEKGYTDDEAYAMASRDFFGQILLSGAGGAISGGVIGGIKGAHNFRMSAKSNKEVGLSVRGAGEIEDTLRMGLQMPQDSQAYALAKKLTGQLKLVQNGFDFSNLSNVEIGRLARQVADSGLSPNGLRVSDEGSNKSNQNVQQGETSSDASELILEKFRKKANNGTTEVSPQTLVDSANMQQGETSSDASELILEKFRKKANNGTTEVSPQTLVDSANMQQGETSSDASELILEKFRKKANNGSTEISPQALVDSANMQQGETSSDASELILEKFRKKANNGSTEISPQALVDNANIQQGETSSDASELILEKFRKKANNGTTEVSPQTLVDNAFDVNTKVNFGDRMSSQEQKAAIDQNLLSPEGTPANYTSSAALAISKGSKKMRKGAEIAQKAGISNEQFIIIYNEINKKVFIYNSDGNTVPLTRDMRRRAYIDSVPGLTRKQRVALYESVGLCKTVCEWSDEEFTRKVAIYERKYGARIR